MTSRSWTVPSVLRDMARRARDSAHLHDIHGGEQIEVDKWSNLAEIWEKRAAMLRSAASGLRSVEVMLRSAASGLPQASTSAKTSPEAR